MSKISPSTCICHIRSNCNSIYHKCICNKSSYLNCKSIESHECYCNKDTNKCRSLFIHDCICSKNNDCRSKHHICVCHLYDKICKSKQHKCICDTNIESPCLKCKYSCNTCAIQ